MASFIIAVNKKLQHGREENQLRVPEWAPLAKSAIRPHHGVGWIYQSCRVPKMSSSLNKWNLQINPNQTIQTKIMKMDSKMLF